MEGLPVKFWGLDPLYWTSVKLFVIEVLKLQQYPGFQGVFAISNHPIARAHVMGYVVSVDKRQKLTIYGVDDGTATIPCCHWIDQDKIPENSLQLNLGDLVSALGKITTFRGLRQITITSISKENDPNSETLHWLEVLRLKDIYNKPFEVPAKFNPKARTANKYWLQTPLDVEIDELEEELKKAISEYLESAKIPSFSIDNLCTVSDVKGKAKQLSDKCDERLTEKCGSDTLPDAEKKESELATKTVIKSLVKKLEKEGIVYCKNVLLGYFDFISVNEDLCPRILGVIKDIGENEGETSYGVSRSKIIQKLKAFEKYKCVRRDKIISALDNLLVSGDIYETKDYHYRRI